MNVSTPATTALRPGTVAILLFLAAALLHLAGLGLEPLRDWDEGTVAQVAREIAARGWSGFWHPTLWGEPYVNKPPLVHGLIALSTRSFGEATWAVRLPPALLSAASVPVLWLLARDLFGRDRPALWSALAFLTLLPVMRHGRLAMLDGALVLFGLLFFLCLGRAGRGSAWAFGAGLALSAAALTKGAAAGIFPPLGLLFLALVNPGVLRQGGVWLAGLLGLLPAALWYAVQVAAGGARYAEAALTNQVLVRIGVEPAQNSGGPGYYLVELLEAGVPWLPFLPLGLALAWRERRGPWAALALPWFLGYLALITAIPGKLPWYLHPLLPPLALLCGRAVEAVLEAPRPILMRVLRSALALLSAAALAGAVLLGPLSSDPSVPLALGAVLLALGLGGAAATLRPGRIAAPALLVAGNLAALLALGLSGRSIWELSEDFPVLPVAQAIQAQVLPDRPLLSTQGWRRPSLDYYAGRPVLPAPAEALLSGEHPDAYWLTTPAEAAALRDRPVLAQAGGRVLLGPAAD